MKRTNLEIFCDCLMWQGGTIHKVSRELSKQLSPKLCAADTPLSMNQNAVKALVDLYIAKNNFSKAIAKGESNA